jgi:hypothetical protein
MIVPNCEGEKPLKISRSHWGDGGGNDRRAIVAGAVNGLQTKPGKTGVMIMVKAVLR